MGKIYKVLTSRLVMTSLIILIQFLVLIIGIFGLSQYSIWIYSFFRILSFSILIVLINSNSSPSTKLPWTIFIILVPLVGGLFYLITTDTKTKKRYQQRINILNHHYKSLLVQNQDVINYISRENAQAASQSDYINFKGFAPLHIETSSQYYPSGEETLEALINDIQNAKHFIFLEFFIITKGLMWDTIHLELLKKVKEGVEVRVMYDDIGSLSKVPHHFYKKLEAEGIKCVPFNPLHPILSVKHNTRDHRKICIIDGYIGYTGGINIGDEYINVKPRFGHWKDTAIRLEGMAVTNLTILFLQSWDNYHHTADDDFSKYMPKVHHPEAFISDGFYQPFGDSPLDDELLGQSVYMNILNMATDYVYITTPYLVVDNEMLFALCLAAKRGVDVRIITPHIPDKWYVHLETRSNYPRLIQAGVKIYEYTPGFIHAKGFICDDQIGVVGTINLDYRSLYHHFECGVWMFQSTTLDAMKLDFINTVSKSQLFTLEDYYDTPILARLIGALLKIFSPLL